MRNELCHCHVQVGNRTGTGERRPGEDGADGGSSCPWAWITVMSPPLLPQSKSVQFGAFFRTFYFFFFSGSLGVSSNFPLSRAVRSHFEGISLISLHTNGILIRFKICDQIPFLYLLVIKYLVSSSVQS